MLIYPNPGTGAFSLNLSNAAKGNYTLSIHDVLGRRISERNVDFSRQKTIPFEINSKGLYFVSLKNGNNRITQKVLVE
jgi:hypothetical protein